MRFAGIDNFEICNGKGCGVTLYVQGCPHHCKGCFNEATWDFNGGKEYTNETSKMIYELTKSDTIDRFSILGGEPLAPANVDMVYQIIRMVKYHRPDIKVWIYSGYRLEELNLLQLKALAHADVLVDGRFIEAQKDVTLPFRGSSNQRLIDIPATFHRTNGIQKPVLLDI